MKKIIFKVAFSRKAGSGHLYRSSNLAQLLKDRGVETILILEKKNKVPKNLKLKRAFDKVLFINNLKNIKDFIDKNNINNFLLDYPKSTINFQKKIQKMVNNFILYQDIPRLNSCNYLINHNYIRNASKIYKKLSNKKTKFFLGTKNFFINFKKKNKIITKNDITVFFGGNTSKTYLEKILSCLREFKIYSFKINIFVGFFDNNFSDIQKKYKELKIFFYKNSSQNFFWKTLSTSKIFIGAGGTTLIEAIYFNVPSIIISRSKNQINNCMNFHKDRIINYAGNNISKKKISKKLKLLITNNTSYQILKKNMLKYKLEMLENNLPKKIFKILI